MSNSFCATSGKVSTPKSQVQQGLAAISHQGAREHTEKGPAAALGRVSVHEFVLDSKVNTAGFGVGNQNPREGAPRSARVGNNGASVLVWQILQFEHFQAFFVFSVSPW